MEYPIEHPERGRRRLSRRSLIRGAAGLTALATFSGLLAACSQPSAAPAQKPAEAAKPAESKPTAAPAAAAPAAKPGETVELRFAWWGSQDRHDRTIKAIQLFEQ